MLPESKRIEGTLRSYIQMHTSISFVYVESWARMGESIEARETACHL